MVKIFCLFSVVLILVQSFQLKIPDSSMNMITYIQQQKYQQQAKGKGLYNLVQFNTLNDSVVTQPEKVQQAEIINLIQDESIKVPQIPVIRAQDIEEVHVPLLKELVAESKQKKKMNKKQQQ